MDEFETGQLAQLIFKRARTLPHGAQQAQREFAADHGCHLQEPLGPLRQPVDARHHDVVDRVGHHQVASQVPGLAGVQGQLLEK